MGTFTGTASVYGIKGHLTYAGIASNADQAFTDAERTDDAELKEWWKDGTGEVLGGAFRDKRKKLTINFLPVSGTGNTFAIAVAAADLPAIPSKVTLSVVKDITGVDLPGINGDWVYDGGGSISYSEGQCKMKLPLMQFNTSTKTATELTTAVA